MKPEPNFQYPIHNLLQKRWSPRAFSDQAVEEKTMMILFEAARWAASSRNEQPWRFIYAHKSNIKRYHKLLECLVEGNRSWAKNAPVLMMTLTKTHFNNKNKPNRWASHDLGLAVGNITTQATALNLYLHNMGGFSVEKAKELFNIPTELEPMTIIAIGYLGNPNQLPENLKERELALRERKALDDLILK